HQGWLVRRSAAVSILGVEPLHNRGTDRIGRLKRSPFHHARAIASAERRVSATNVSVPLVQPPVGVVGAPTTKRFSWSCVRPWLSHTLVAGSVPIRHPPPG